jgi:hypothetical protein
MVFNDVHALFLAVGVFGENIDGVVNFIFYGEGAFSGGGTGRGRTGRTGGTGFAAAGEGQRGEGRDCGEEAGGVFCIHGRKMVVVMFLLTTKARRTKRMKRTEGTEAEIFIIGLFFNHGVSGF